MAGASVRNGISLEGLSRLARETQGSIEAVARTEWLGGMLASTQVERAGEGSGSFRLDADAATGLLGTGRAPGAIDLLLAAASVSFVQSFTLHAAEAGVVIDSLALTAEATALPATAVGAPGTERARLSRVDLRYAVETTAG